MVRSLAFVAAFLLLLTTGGVYSRKQTAGRAEPQIEEVTSKQLERVLAEKDFVAVFWCKCLLAFVQCAPM